MGSLMSDRLISVSGPTDAAVTITMNRPEKKNALSIAMRDQISDALDGLASDEAVKVVILTGAGDVFSAGFDLREFGSEDPDVQAGLWPSSDRFHRTVLQHPLPIVAAVNGPALAGGFDLAAMCDIRIASVTARFAHPEQSFSDVVYGPLHDLVGGAAARYLCLSGRSVDAMDALRLGIVSEVVAAGELAAAARGLARDIARAPRDILVRTKAKALRRASGPAGTATLEL